MGEEWGSRQPFPFFCDFKGDLAEAVRNGRKGEFAEAYANTGTKCPDPLAEATMRSAKLDWTDALQRRRRRAVGADQKRCCGARREHIVPLMPHLLPGRAEASFERRSTFARNGELHDRKSCILAGNFSDRERRKVAGIAFDTTHLGRERSDTLAAMDGVRRHRSG